jgi:hypothetical protein
MPIYMNLILQQAVPPALKKRMQGKACFNFNSIDPELLRALKSLTGEAIASFKDVTLPWDDRQPAKKATGRTPPRDGA